MDYPWDLVERASPLVDRSRFLDVPTGSYLATAGEGLMPADGLAAIERYMRTKANPPLARAEQAAIDERVRGRLASLLDTAPERLGLLSNASHGLTSIFGLIDWQAGDNVVLMTSDLEFPSLVLPAVKLVREQDIEMRVVDHTDWIVTPGDIASAVDERTRLVVVSHVSYRTGFRLDLHALRRELSGSDAWLVVDASQSLGAVPVELAPSDFIVATSCKWMLAPHGIGVLAWNPERTGDLTPRDVGWYSVIDDLQIPYELKPGAARFELGSPPWPTIYALDAGLAMIEEVGIERISAHNELLASQILIRAGDRGLPVVTPDDPGLRAGIVSWLDDDCAATARRLQDHDVYVTGSSGRIRASVHLYNDDRDVDRLFDAL